MSARRDKSQRITFLYSNLYEVYRKEKAKQSTFVNTQKDPVLRIGDLKKKPEIREYKPTELLGKRLELDRKRKEALTRAPSPKGKDAVSSLKSNLNDLTDLHSRLKFMLGELESLIGEDSKD